MGAGAQPSSTATPGQRTLESGTPNHKQPPLCNLKPCLAPNRARASPPHRPCRARRTHAYLRAVLGIGIDDVTFLHLNILIIAPRRPRAALPAPAPRSRGLRR